MGIKYFAGWEFLVRGSLAKENVWQRSLNRRFIFRGNYAEKIRSDDRAGVDVRHAEGGGRS